MSGIFDNELTFHNPRTYKITVNSSVYPTTIPCSPINHHHYSFEVISFEIKSSLNSVDLYFTSELNNNSIEKMFDDNTYGYVGVKAGAHPILLNSDYIGIRSAKLVFKAITPTLGKISIYCL